MEQVRTAEKSCLLVGAKGVEADWAVRVVALESLLFDSCPELAKFLRCLPLAIHNEGALFLLVHDTLYVWEEGLEELLGALDVIVD